MARVPSREVLYRPRNATLFVALCDGDANVRPRSKSARQKCTAALVIATIAVAGGVTVLLTRGSTSSLFVATRARRRGSRRTDYHESVTVDDVPASETRLQVNSIDPSNGAAGANAIAPISLSFSAAISSQLAMPTPSRSAPGRTSSPGGRSLLLRTNRSYRSAKSRPPFPTEATEPVLARMERSL